MKVTKDDLNNNYFTCEVEQYRKEHDHSDIKWIRKALFKELDLKSASRDKLLPILINFLRKYSATDSDSCDKNERLSVDAEAFNCFEAISENGPHHIDIVEANLPKGLTELCSNIVKHLASDDVCELLKSESNQIHCERLANESDCDKAGGSNVSDIKDLVTNKVEESQNNLGLTDILQHSEPEVVDDDVDTCLPIDVDFTRDTCLPDAETCLPDLNSDGSRSPSPSLLDNPQYLAACEQEQSLLEQSLFNSPPSPSLLDRRAWRRTKRS